MFNQISDSVYCHTKGTTVGNVSIIATDIGNFVVDTSMYPKLARDIRLETEKIGVGKVAGALITHYHFDHTGGNQHFQDVSIYSHQLAKQNFETQYDEEEMKNRFLNSDKKEFFENFKLTPPNKVFRENMFSVPENSNIEIYLVGGHTNGSCLILYKPEMVMFAGDDLTTDRYMWGGDPTASPYDWLNASKKMLELNPKIIVPGHGPEQFNQNEIVKLEKYLTKVISVTEKMLKENVTNEQIIEDLLKIEFQSETVTDRKKDTLKKWIEVISSEKRYKL